jgi:hypothetical protein
LLVENDLQIAGGGSAANPDLYFFPDSDTGLFQTDLDTLGFSTGGIQAGMFTQDGDFYARGRVLVQSGNDPIAPDFSFANSRSMGMYNDLLNVLSFATSGARAGYFNATQDFVVTNSITSGTDVTSGTYVAAGSYVDAGSYVEAEDLFRSVATGTVTDPVFTWASDLDTGMYRISANNLAFTAGGQQFFFMDENNIIAPGSGGGSEIYHMELASKIRLVIADGGSNSPSILFNTGKGTTGVGPTAPGLYLASAGVGGMSSNGLPAVTWFADSNGGIMTTQGTKGAFRASPGDIAGRTYAGFGFDADTNTGLTQNVDADGSIAFLCNGVIAGYFDDNDDLYVTRDIDAIRNIHAGGDVATTDDAYAAGWSGSSNVPTKNAVYDKIESLSGGSVDVTYDTINAGAIESGYGNFYANIRSHRFLISETNSGAPYGSTSDVQFGWAQETYSPAGDKDVTSYTGFFSDTLGEIGVAAGDLEIARFSDGGNIKMSAGAEFMGKPDGDPSAPQFIISSDDINTGIWQDSADPDKINFGCGGVNQGLFDTSGLVVPLDVRAGRVRSGMGFFYTHLIAGEPGFEESSISVGGTEFHSVVQINDLGSHDSGEAQIHLHRHSNSLPSAIIGSRARGETYSHTTLQHGDQTLALIASGYGDTTYEVGGRINFVVDSPDGTVGDNNMPMKIDFRTQPPNVGNLNGLLGMSIGSDQVVDVPNKLMSGRVEAGIGNFYLGVITVKESEAGGASFFDDTVAFHSSQFYVSSGGDGNPLVSLNNQFPAMTVADRIVQTAGTRSVFIGGGTTGNALDSTDNVVIGDGAGAAMQSTSVNNVLIGTNAGKAITLADHTICIGANAGAAITTGGNSGSIFIGKDAGITADTNIHTCIGYLAGASMVGAATRNTFIGFQSGNAAIINEDCTFIGFNTGALCTGDRNTLIGAGVGAAITTGINNTLVGYDAGTGLETGDGNTCIGNKAGRNVTGDDSTIVGNLAGDAPANSGTNNTFFGTAAGSSNTTAANNTFIGYQAGTAAAGGGGNTCVGSLAGTSNVSGLNNTCIGRSAGQIITGTNNVCIGNFAGDATTSGGTNTYIGSPHVATACTGSGNVFLGSNAGRFQGAVSNKFILNNQSQGTAAADLTDSLLVGDFNATVSSQNLVVNANAYITHSLSGTPDEITATNAGVAASLLTINTEVTTNLDGDLDDVTLANGRTGQIKNIYCVVSQAGDTWKITPSAMLGGTQITFGDNSVGAGCTLVYADNEGWCVVGNNGGTIT